MARMAIKMARMTGKTDKDGDSVDDEEEALSCCCFPVARRHNAPSSGCKELQEGSPCEDDAGIELQEVRFDDYDRNMWHDKQSGDDDVEITMGNAKVMTETTGASHPAALVAI